MRYIFVITIAVMAFGAGAAPPSKAPIEKDINKLVGLFSDGLAISYPQYWQIEFGNVFGNGRQDAVAIFSLEGFDGGNDDHQYLALFKAVPPDSALKPCPFRLVAVALVGGRLWREFDGQKIIIGTNSITLSGKKYGTKDAVCCPSVPIQVTFHLKDGVILESK